MKKILTLFFALVAVMSASAAEKSSALDLSKMYGWGEEQSTYSYNSETGVGTITAYAWKGATLYYGSTNPYDATGYEQVELELASACTQKVSMTVYYADGSYNVAYIAVGDTKCVVNLAKYSIDKIDICNFSATNSVTIELKSLKLNGWKGTRNAETISTESKDLGNWSWDDRYLVSAEKFTNATAGSKLIFTFTEDTEVTGESETQTCTYWQICTMDGEGTVLTGNSADLSSNNMNFSSGQTCYAMELNASDVELLKKNGLMVRGYGVTITQVDLVYYDPTKDGIDLSQSMNTWAGVKGESTTYDATTKTITFSSSSDSWGGAGWWYGTDASAKDCSGYTKIVYEFASAAPAAGGISIQYNDGTSGWASFAAEKTTAECAFDVAKSSQVKAIYLQLSASESLTLKRVYFANAYTETRATATNSYGTICLPYDATATGAVLMTINGKTTNGIAFDYAGETAETSTSLKAGVPYLYRATADAQSFRYDKTAEAVEATENNKFLGVYAETAISEGQYFLYTGDNMFHPAGADGKIGAYKCYITDLAGMSEAENNARQSVVFGVYDETTGLQTVNTTVDLSKNGKFLENGRLVIVKDNKKFNAAGQLVK